MNPDKFYESQGHTPPFMLLKRSAEGDFAWGNGEWSHTFVIVDYMFGHNDWVEDLTDVEARTKYPEAFA